MAEDLSISVPFLPKRILMFYKYQIPNVNSLTHATSAVNCNSRNSSSENNDNEG